MISIVNSQRQKGVTKSPHRAKPWVTRLYVNHRSIYIGAFATYEEATDAYRAAYRRYLDDPAQARNHIVGNKE